MKTNLILNINFKMLEKQKRAFLELIEGTDTSNEINGILNLLDEIQDQAAEQHGEKKVFFHKE